MLSGPSETLTRRVDADRSASPNGQVAQLVEQGTENPRVGGSIPSLATFFLPLVLAGISGLSGCSSDQCYALCGTTANAVGGCLDEWGVTWEYFGASKQKEWGDTCRSDWETEKATLEPRQVQSAQDECAAAAAELATPDCDELRALYL